MKVVYYKGLALTVLQNYESLCGGCFFFEEVNDTKDGCTAMNRLVGGNCEDYIFIKTSKQDPQIQAIQNIIAKHTRGGQNK